MDDTLIAGKYLKVEYGTAINGYHIWPNDTSKSGKITATTEYVDGVRNGIRVQFFNYPSDTASVETYKNDTLNGTFYYRYPDGKLWCKGLYRNGEIDIAATNYYSPEGLVIDENIQYDPDSQCYLMSGEKCQGKISFYGHSGDDNQRVRAELFFTDGKIDSLYKYRWAFWGMSTKDFYNFKDSILVSTSYYPKSGIQYIYEHKISAVEHLTIITKENEHYVSLSTNLYSDGRSIEYFPNGNLQREGFYQNGRRVGTWKAYNENGVLINTEQY